MVVDRDNQTIISTQAVVQSAQPSFKRWLKHSLSFKNSRRCFNLSQQEQIAQAITQAEDGHRGEIQVIIEANLPSDCAYHVDTLQRAQYLFGKYRVWDTEQNSGILIYLNLCEKKLELVADRGINAAVDGACWDKICQSMLPYFKEKKLTEGLCCGITHLGDVLTAFYGEQSGDSNGNELSNLPRLL